MQPQLKDIPFRDGEFAERSCARLYKVNSIEIGCKSELMTMVVQWRCNDCAPDDSLMHRVAGGTATAMTQTWTVSDCSTLAAFNSRTGQKLQNRQIATLSLAAPSDIDISPQPIICPTTVKISKTQVNPWHVKLLLLKCKNDILRASTGTLRNVFLLCSWPVLALFLLCSVLEHSGL